MAFKHINENQLGVLGRFGEDAAVDFLKKLGYKIIARNVVYNKCEIDIVAEDLRHIIFVEVKTRTVSDKFSASIYGAPADAVNSKKRKNIKFAAKEFLKERFYRKLVRFDIVEVYAGKNDSCYYIKKINHHADAFQASGKTWRK